MPDFNFIDTNFIFKNNIISNDIPLEILDNYDNEYFSTIKNWLNPTVNINKLQNNLIETLTYHNKTLSSIHLPESIDIKFLNTSLLETLKNKIMIQEPLAQTWHKTIDNKKQHTISISTDFSKEKLILPYKFNRELRNSFSNIKNVDKIMTEIMFLHELGHIYLKHNHTDTITVVPLRQNKDSSSRVLTQLTNNIQEAFCDSFACYLAQIRYPESNLITKFQKVRQDTFSIDSKDDIAPYDVDYIFDQITPYNINQNNFIPNLLEIAINNGINIMVDRLDDNTFKNKLTDDLKLILQNDYLKLNNKQDFVNLLKEELFKFNPADKTKLNDELLVNNIFKVREKYTSENSNNKLNKII